MRDGFVFAGIAGLSSLALAQEPATPAKTGDSQPNGDPCVPMVS
jgi:hypothetical protein